MKCEGNIKLKRSIYNLVFGLGCQVVTVALGIVIPRLFLVNFGSEINGLLSSINQIFVYFGLLEAGVGGAALQALYGPISKNDKDGVNGIISATEKYYKKTGTYYFIAVVGLAIIYPFFINSNLNKIEVIIIILLSGMSGVINFFFQGKFKQLLYAEGKGYIISLITTLISILTSVSKIILLLMGYNIILIQFSYFLINIFQMCIYSIYINKNYKWIDFSVKPNDEALVQKNSVLVYQISSLVFSNTDVLVLTVFCGLKVVSVYVIYNMIFEMINTAIQYINTSIVFILGQTYNNNKESFSKLYEAYELYYISIVFAFYSIAYMLILPFIKLYTKGITDVNYVDFWLIVLFITLKLLACARTPGMNAINIAGHFKETKNRAILEATINIVASLIFVNIFGIYGVLIGTIIAVLYRANDIIFYASKYIVKRSPGITYKRWIINAILFLIIIFISNELNFAISSYMNIIIVGIILLIILVPAFIIVASVFEVNVFKNTLNYLRKPSANDIFVKTTK